MDQKNQDKSDKKPPSHPPVGKSDDDGSDTETGSGRKQVSVDQTNPNNHTKFSHRSLTSKASPNVGSSIASSGTSQRSRLEANKQELLSRAATNRKTAVAATKATKTPAPRSYATSTTSEETNLETKRRLASRGTRSSTTRDDAADSMTSLNAGVASGLLDEKWYMAHRAQSGEGHGRAQSKDGKLGLVDQGRQRQLSTQVHAEADESTTEDASFLTPTTGSRFDENAHVQTDYFDPAEFMDCPGAIAIPGPGFRDSDQDSSSSSSPEDESDQEASLESGLVVLEATTVEPRAVQAHVSRQVPLAEAKAAISCRTIVFGLVVASAVTAGVVLAVVLPNRGSTKQAPSDPPAPETAMSPTPTLTPAGYPTFAPSTSSGDPITTKAELISAIDSCKNSGPLCVRNSN